jgi:hypothetical protein
MRHMNKIARYRRIQAVPVRPCLTDPALSSPASGFGPDLFKTIHCSC